MLINTTCKVCPMRTDCKTYRFIKLANYEEKLRSRFARKERKEKPNGKEE